MKDTKIEWCDHSWSPWEGCSKVSPGCAHCYAESLNRRFGKDNWGKGKPRRLTVDWDKPVKWNRKAFAPTSVFPSLCDWLDDEVPIEWLARFLKLIHDTPNLDWLLLTKRPENWGHRIAYATAYNLAARLPSGKWGREWMDGNPPSNVWIGTSVEDQTNADRRIPELIKIPARVRFLSVEPLLGPVDLEKPMPGPDLDQGSGLKICQPWYTQSGIDWIIVGGESGPKARPCNVEWIRDVVRQCADAKVPCFVKQDSGRFPGARGRIDDETWSHKEFPCATS